MIAAWMLYAIAVGVLLTAAAWVADAACRLLRRPRRGVWAAALAGTVTAAVWGATLGTPGRPDVGRRDASRPAERAVAPALGVVPNVVRPLVAPAPRLTSPSWLAVGPSNPLRALDRALVTLWLGAAAVGAATLAAGARRLARARRRWRPLGTGVLVADDYGPAVAGVYRPAIVVPRWTLALAPDDLALVLAHERAHVAARDPLLLAAALVALVALPWLLPLWLVVVRLRLAVESDCDRRVLRAHPDAVRYGRLLVDVAERALTLGTPAARWRVATAPALLDPPRVLETRIRDLVTPTPGRGAGVRAAALLAAAASAAALACMTPRPTEDSHVAARPAERSPVAARPTDDSLAAQRALVDSLRAQVATLRARVAVTPASDARPSRATSPSLRDLVSPASRVRAPSEDELRADVAQAAPAALTGALGHRPFVWLVYDSAGHVALSATGDAGIRIDVDTASSGAADTVRVLNAYGIFRTFPSLHEQQLHSFGWSRVAAGADTVQVIWVRPTSLGWKLSDFATDR